jgi:cytochrome P450
MPLIEEVFHNYDKTDGPRTVLSLAIESCTKTHLDVTFPALSPASFLESLVLHVKMFLFAGHDTTGSTLSYIFYLLSQNNEKAAKVHAEHNMILGPDPAAASERIKEDATILNRLPYTNAVVKETLRLYPPVGGTIRQTSKNFFLTHPDAGTRYPTEGFMVHPSASTLGRDPMHWLDADVFLPERWLVDDISNPYHPVKGTWRPFEVGPRSCIGQELASLELRLALALTVREFDIKEMYPENAVKVFGHKAYQVLAPEQSATAHVKNGMPVRIRARSA